MIPFSKNKKIKNLLKSKYQNYFSNGTVMGGKSLVEELVSTCILTMKKERENIEEEVLGPMVEYVITQLKPYILGTCIFFAIMTVLIISIIFLIIFKPSKSSSS